MSRYGKAALVAMAFDTSFAMALVASSGESGTKPHRRNFGETVENQTASDAYHWMAGNSLKYGASDADSGAKTAADIPIDAGELIAQGTGLLQGQLAWREHLGGHTDAPNVKYFIEWADRLMGRQTH